MLLVIFWIAVCAVIGLTIHSGNKHMGWPRR